MKSKVSLPPAENDLSRAWLVSLPAIFSGITMAFLLNKVAPAIPTMMADLHIEMGTAGLLSTIFSLIGIFVAIPAVKIIQHLGIKKSGVLSLCIALFGSLLGILSSNLIVLIFSRIIEGMGTGLISVIVPTLISEWFPPNKRGFPMGIWGAWMTIASSLAFFISTSIISRYSWRGLWIFGMIMTIVSLILFALFVESPPKKTIEEAESNFAITKEVWHLSSSWTLALAALFFTFISFSFGTWILSFWSQKTNWSDHQITTIIATIYFLEIFLAIFIGYLLDKIKNKHRFGVISFLIYGLIGALCFFVKIPILIFIVALLFPAFDALIPTVLWTIAPQTAFNPLFASLSISILNVGLNIGTLISGPLAGQLVSSFGWNIFSVFLLSTGVLGGVVFSRVKIES
ncbi:CynX/NimT family MFS transporter [Enterococcus devriesei]|uniref:MFS transporter n=1 Tax=Enterococcus devriesei TaxID=319970 RepID=UPI0036D2C89A